MLLINPPPPAGLEKEGGWGIPEHAAGSLAGESPSSEASQAQGGQEG